MYKGEPIKYTVIQCILGLFCQIFFYVLCSSLPSITHSSYFDGITKLVGLLKKQILSECPLRTSRLAFGNKKPHVLLYY